MRVELELWHVLTLVITLIGAFWGMFQRLQTSSREVLTTQFDALTKLVLSQSAMIEGQGQDMRRIERDLMALKAELPRDYVRREDYLQAIATIMTKIDAVALRVERALERVTLRPTGATPGNHPAEGPQ